MDRNTQAIVFGTGAIAGGVVLPMLHEAKIAPIVVARNPERYKDLLESPGVHVTRVNSHISSESTYVPFHAVIQENPDHLVEYLTDQRVRLIFTAVGKSNLPAVANALAPALKVRQKQRVRTPLCILVLENVASSGRHFGTMLEDCAAGSTLGIHLPTTMVDCMSFRQYDGKITREAHSEVVIGITGFEETDALICRLPNIALYQDAEYHYERKIALVSAIHTAIAWIGIFAEREYTSDAASDDRFTAFLYSLVDEMAQAVYSLTDKTFALNDLVTYGRQTIERVNNPHLLDHCKKFVRSLPTKLSTTERFGRPAIRIFEDFSIIPLALCQIMALGLWLGKCRLNAMEDDCLAEIDKFPDPIKHTIIELAENPSLLYEEEREELIQ
ncbi:MAG: hypothetical protein NT135_01015 [Candidatus Berkelbacteria bacterium]|nr:hypothetical protein [Candidatus Berkelbacteria bacterium]